MGSDMRIDAASTHAVPGGSSDGASQSATAKWLALSKQDSTGSASGTASGAIPASTEASGGAWALPAPAALNALLAPVLDPGGSASLTNTYVAELKAGKTVQQIQDTGSFTELHAKSLNNALETLGISNRQVGILAGALQKDTGRPGLPSAGQATDQTQIQNRLIAVMRARVGIDGDSGPELRGFNANPFTAPPVNPQIGSIQGAIAAFREGEAAPGTTASTTGLDASALLYLPQSFHNPASGAVAVFYTDAPTLTIPGANAALSNADIATAGAQGRRILAETSATQGADVPAPPVLDSTQLAAIGKTGMQTFLGEAKKAPHGSNLNIVYNLYTALALSQDAKFKGHVDVPKVKAELEQRLKLPDVAEALSTARSSAVQSVTGESEQQYVTKLSNYIVNLPSQPGYLALLQSNPDKAAGLLSNAEEQLTSFDPAAAIAAQAGYVDNFFSGPNQASILQAATSDSLDAARGVVGDQIMAGVNPDNAAAAGVGLTRFAVSGINNALKGISTLSPGDQRAALDATTQAIATVEAENPALAGNPAQLGEAVVAELQTAAPSGIRAGAVAFASALVKNGSLGTLATALSLAAFGAGVPGADTPAQKLAVAGNFLLAVGNSPGVVNTLGAVGALTAGQVTAFAPFARAIGLATPAALAVWTASYAAAAAASAAKGNDQTAGLQGTTSGLVGIAFLTNVRGALASIVATGNALGNALPQLSSASQAAAATEAAVGEIELVGVGTGAAGTVAVTEGVAATATEAALATTAADIAVEGGAAAVAGAAVAEGGVFAAAATSVDWITGPAAPFITGAALILGTAFGVGAAISANHDNAAAQEAAQTALLQSGVGDGNDYYLP